MATEKIEGKMFWGFLQKFERKFSKVENGHEKKEWIYFLKN